MKLIAETYASEKNDAIMKGLEQLIAEIYQCFKESKLVSLCWSEEMTLNVGT